MAEDNGIASYGRGGVLAAAEGSSGGKDLGEGEEGHGRSSSIPVSVGWAIAKCCSARDQFRPQEGYVASP